MSYYSAFEIDLAHPKLTIEDNIKVTIHKDGSFTYKMLQDSIQELIWEWSYRYVKFNGNKTKNKYRLTLEEII